jgi:hypothetical protein
MTRENCRMAALVLAAGLSIFGAVSQAQMTNPRAATAPKRAQTVQKDVPAEFKSGIAQLISAKSILEKAGDKWGGHRVKAIHLIDEALAAVGQPQAKSAGEMKSGPKDVPADLQSGIAGLNSAKSDFERAGNQWGGRKAKAISLINEALRELQTGIEFAKSHGTY